MTIEGRLSKRQVQKLVYMSGLNGDYQVHHNIPGEAIVCHVPNVSIGNEIVRALRERQYFIAREQKRRAAERAANVEEDARIEGIIAKSRELRANDSITPSPIDNPQDRTEWK